MDYRAALVGIKFLLAKRRTLRKANDLNINLKKGRAEYANLFTTVATRL